jgi:hypothetical protein
MDVNAVKFILIAFLFSISIISSALAEDSGASWVQTFDNGPINTVTPEAQYSSSVGSSSGGGNFVSQEGYPIIKRDVNPNFKDFYVNGKSYRIEVEIQGCARSFYDVMIKERIDPDLETDYSILNISISDPFKIQTRYIKKSSTVPSNNNINYILENMKNEYTIYDKSVYIKISKLLPFEDVSYAYKIRSDKTGMFEVLTRFRLNDSNWPDLEKKDLIEVRPPEINIITETDKSYAIIGEPISVTYDILQKIGWSKESVNFSGSFDNTNEFDILYNNGTVYKKGDNIILKFKPLQSIIYPIKIRYNHAGTHPFPMMNISDAMVSQEKLDIEVFSSGFEKTLQDNGIFISLLISILLIILSLTEFHISNKELEIIKQIRIKDFTKTDYDKILHDQNWLLKGFLTICMLYIIVAVIVSNIIPLIWSLPIGILLILTIQYILYNIYKNHIIK